MSALGTESQPFEVCDAGGSTGVSGTITAAGSGALVSGGWVAVLRTNDFSIAGVGFADGNGDYTAGVPAGSYFLYLIDPTGHHTAGFFGSPTMVTVPAGTVVDANPTMVPTRGSIAGTVVDTTATPIADALVVALTNGGVAEIATTANAAGEYTLGGLRTGNHFVGFVDPNGNHRSEFWPDSLNVPDATTLAVSAGTTTVADSELAAQSGTATGSLLSGTVVQTGTDAPLEDVVVLALHASDFRLARAATTNSAGEYSLDVEVGLGYKLAFLDANGLHGFEWHDNQPNTGLGSSTTVVAPAVTDAALDALTGTQTGTIVDDPSGEPLGCAWVFAIGPTGIAGGTVTAADGTYTITGLAPGTYRATFVDPMGGRAQEYFNNSPDYAGATPYSITAGNTVTIDAALSFLPPTNDDFDNAQIISGATGTVSGTNQGATKENGEPNHADHTGGKSVWYQWTAPSTGTVSFDTCGSDFDTLLAAYAGTTVNALSDLAGNANSCGLASEISFSATSGITYHIAVDGWNADSGDLNLNWAMLAQPPTFLDAWGESLGGGEFDGPYGVAVDSSGHVYVADVGNDRIQKFTSTGAFVTQWGTTGDGDGEFNGPWGIAIDGSGNVYVSDLFNGRVQKFSSTGTYLAQFGSSGTGSGEFVQPRGVAVDASGNVYVVDRWNYRVQKFSQAGTYLTQWGTEGNGNGEFENAPWGIAVDQATGTVYVTHQGFDSSWVEVFNSTGAYVSQFAVPTPSLFGVDGVAVDSSGYVYVTDSRDQVYKYTSTGEFESQWSTHTFDGFFSYPRGIAIDQSSGHVYSTNYDEHWVQRDTSTGDFVNRWGTGPTGDGRLSSPSGAAVNQSSGDVYVADLSNNRIQRFSATGAYLGQWGGTLGGGDGEFQWAEHVAVNSVSGDVYVTDQFSSRVQRFSSTGAYLGQWGTVGTEAGQFGWGGADGVAVDGTGHVYVADRGNDRVQKFSATGTYITEWGTTGTGNGQFESPGEIAVDPSSGNVYVADWDRVQVFSPTGTYLSQIARNADGGMAVDESGNLYTVDTFGHRVRVFTPAGALLTRWGDSGSGNGQFRFPQGVALGPSGNVYVVDQGNNRVQRYSPVSGAAIQPNRDPAVETNSSQNEPKGSPRPANSRDDRGAISGASTLRPILPDQLSPWGGPRPTA